MPTTLIDGLSRRAFFTSAAAIGSPHVAVTSTTSAPKRLAKSAMRMPKNPFTPTSIVSPGSMRFARQDSIPEKPVPVTGEREFVFRTEEVSQLPRGFHQDFLEYRGRDVPIPVVAAPP